MKKIFLFFVCIALFYNTNAQTPNWVWAISAEANSNGITTDVTGNIYNVGSFSTATCVFNTITLNNAGSSDMYIAKYDVDGNVIWAHSAGGSGADEATSVISDANRNIYVTGFFASTSITFGNITLNGNGSSEMFVVKYDSTGNVIWAKSASGVSNGNGITVDQSGNVIITGSCGNSVNFNNVNLTGNGGMFIVKYDNNGNAIWAKNTSGVGSSSSIGTSITSDNIGDIYVTGTILSETVFGNVTLNDTSIGTTDIFVVKYDNGGNVIWAKGIGGASNDYSSAIAIDQSNNIYITGYFQSYTMIVGNTTLTTSSQDNMYLVKYDNNGNVLWAKCENQTPSDNMAYSISTDALNNVYTTGSFSLWPITFGNFTLNTYYTSGTNYTNDIFAVKYDSDGNVIWATGAGGESNDEGTSIAISNNNVFVSGDYESTSILFGSTTLNSNGTMFIGKLNTTTGLTQPIVKNDIAVYPVPNEGSMTIKLNGTGYSFLYIYNAVGQMVYKNKLNSNDFNATINIFLQSPKEGIYFLEALNMYGNINKSIAIEN